MKKFYIVLLAMALAVVFAVPAMAIHIGDIRDPDGGELGINGKYVLDGEKVDYDGDENAWYDNDVDVMFQWTDGDVMVYWRAELDDSEGLVGAKNNAGIIDDLWVSYQFNDNLKFKFGEYYIGSSAIADDSTGGFNIQAMYGLDAADLSLAIVKKAEGVDDTGTDEVDADTDRIVLSAKVKEAGPLTKLNFTYVMEDNELTEEGANFMLLEAAAPIGPVTVGLQYGTFGGTNANAYNGTDGTTYGLGGAVAAGDVDAEGNYILATFGLDELVGFGLDLGYFVASEDLYGLWNEDWAPFQIILDEVGFYETARNVTAIWVAGDYAYNDDLTLAATYVMATLTDDAGFAGDEIGSEIDLVANYKIADNVSYKAAIGSFSDGDLGFGDITKYFNRLTVTF